jgi:hypothetical protein
MTNLRGENHALRAELSAQQQQLADAAMAARSGGGPHSRHGAASSFLSNKKNEDDTFDVEAAVLTGAALAHPLVLQSDEARIAGSTQIMRIPFDKCGAE